MATITQFLRNPKPKSVCVVSGKSEILRNYALERLLGMISPSQVRKQTSPKNLLSLVGAQPMFDETQAIICENVHKWGDLSFFEWYLERPTERTTVILTAEGTKRSDGERWIPSSKKVLYIDCGVTDASIEEFVRLHGVEDTEWVVQNLADDHEELIRVLRLVSVAGEASSDLPKQLSTVTSEDDRWKRYAILNNHNGSGLFRQAQRRFFQMLQLLGEADEKAPVIDVAKRLNMEAFMVKKLMPVAQSHSKQEWLEKLTELALAQDYSHSPAAEQYVYGLLD